MDIMDISVTIIRVVVYVKNVTSKYGELILLPHQYNFRIIVKLGIKSVKYREVQADIETDIMGIDKGDSVPKDITNF